jgi:hypothetical protein
VKFNNNGRSRTHITRQHNLPLYNRGSSSWKAILTHCLQNWMQKKQG